MRRRERSLRDGGRGVKDGCARPPRHADHVPQAIVALQDAPKKDRRTFVAKVRLNKALARWNRRSDGQRKINILVHISLKRLAFWNFHIVAVLQ